MKVARERLQAFAEVRSSSILELSQAQLELTSRQIATTNARYDIVIQEVIFNYQVGELVASRRGVSQVPK